MMKGGRTKRVRTLSKRIVINRLVVLLSTTAELLSHPMRRLLVGIGNLQHGKISEIFSDDLHSHWQALGIELHRHSDDGTMVD